MSITSLSLGVSIHFQKPLCLKAKSCLLFEAFSKGFFSNISLSPRINLKNFELATKKPPLIHPFVTCGFSLNDLTKFLFKTISPNLAGGLTAVTVISFSLINGI